MLTPVHLIYLTKSDEGFIFMEPSNKYLLLFSFNTLKACHICNGVRTIKNIMHPENRSLMQQSATDGSEEKRCKPANVKVNIASFKLLSAIILADVL